MSSPGYYDLAETGDDDLTSAFDSYPNLPDAGHSAALDAFVARKNIDIAALVRVGARLSAETTLAFGFPGGIKYRNMENGQRWAAAGSAWSRLKVIRAGAQRSDAVLVCEGETDAARLTMLYKADVAVLPAGALTFTQQFADQLQEYPQVLVATDNDGPGEQGYEKVLPLIAHAQRLLPPANDWCDVGPSDPVPPLPAPPELPDRVGGIVLADIMPAFEGRMPAPPMLIDGLLYGSGVHWLFGHPGAGKSLFAMWLTQQVMADGHHILWLDYEMGIRRSGVRMSAFDVDDRDMAERFHYAWDPGDALQYLPAVAERWPRAVIVVDSASKALGALNIDENSADEVKKWTQRLVRGCGQYGLTVIVIDHVAKTSTGQYARGSGAKLSDADAAMRLTVEQAYSKGVAGMVRLDWTKDRDGEMPIEAQYFQAGALNGGLDFVPCSPPEEDTPKDKAAPGI